MGAKVSFIMLCLLASLASLDHVSATRLKGSINYSKRNRNFVFFLTRFGVRVDHEVYVFGKAERTGNNAIGQQSLMTLTFIPQGTWNNLYSRSRDPPSVRKCQDVVNMTLGNSIIVGENICASGFNDYLRKVPCDPDGEHYIYCNQPESVTVIPGSDFTFHVQSAPKTEFYYVFIIACTRNATETCNWAGSDDVYFKYDVTVVNSDPTGHKDYFDYQFSFEFHGVLILQLSFTVLYLILVAIQFMLHSRLVSKKQLCPHPLVQLFTASLVLDFLHVGCEMIHYSVYAANGNGAIAMRYFGEVFNLLSDWLLILVLILVAKGWQVTTCSIRWKKLTSVVWCVYILFSAIYFVWMVVSFNYVCIQFKTHKYLVVVSVLSPHLVYGLQPMLHNFSYAKGSELTQWRTLGTPA